ncbi:hypothetical protein [Streptomyces axinellae]
MPGAPAAALDPLLRWKAHRWYDCLLDTGPGPGSGPRWDSGSGPALGSAPSTLPAPGSLPRPESDSGSGSGSGSGFRSRPGRRLTFRDYELAAERLTRSFRRRPGCREHRRLLGCFRRLWRLHDRAGAGVQDLEAFTAGLALALAGRRRALVAAVNSLCCAMVDLADADGDGVLSEREYRVLLAAGFGLRGEDELRTAYSTLDRDGSGMLEHNEVHEAFVEFFTSADPHAQGNWLLGAPRTGDTGP